MTDRCSPGLSGGEALSSPGPSPMARRIDPAPLAGAHQAPTGMSRADYRCARRYRPRCSPARRQSRWSSSRLNPTVLAAVIGATSNVRDQAAQGLPNGLHKEVLGFLPYWMLDATELQWLRYDLLSTIAYFGVAAQWDGTLATYAPGWHGWYQRHDRGHRCRPCARGEGRLDHHHDGVGRRRGSGRAPRNATARTWLVDAIVAAVRDRNADGVNLDFEPVSRAQQAQYTSFVRQLKAGLVAAGVGVLSDGLHHRRGRRRGRPATTSAALVAPGRGGQHFRDGVRLLVGALGAGGVGTDDPPYMLDVRIGG